MSLLSSSLSFLPVSLSFSLYVSFLIVLLFTFYHDSYPYYFSLFFLFYFSNRRDGRNWCLLRIQSFELSFLSANHLKRLSCVSFLVISLKWIICRNSGICKRYFHWGILILSFSHDSSVDIHPEWSVQTLIYSYWEILRIKRYYAIEKVTKRTGDIISDCTELFFSTLTRLRKRVICSIIVRHCQGNLHIRRRTIIIKNIPWKICILYRLMISCVYIKIFIMFASSSFFSFSVLHISSFLYLASLVSSFSRILSLSLFHIRCLCSLSRSLSLPEQIGISADRWQRPAERNKLSSLSSRLYRRKIFRN